MRIENESGVVFLENLLLDSYSLILLLPTRFANTHEFSSVSLLTDTDTTEIKFSDISTYSTTVRTTVVETSRMFWFFTKSVSTFCLLESGATLVYDCGTSHKRES
jgi:hypothetical protein